MWARSFLLGALALVCAPAASAQDIEAARRHFETGTQAFETGDYDLSVSAFQAAYDITGHPDILFNIYSAAERAGRLEVAADALDRHLREAEVDAEQRASLEQRLGRLRQRIREAASESPPPDADATDPPGAQAPVAPGREISPSPFIVIGAGAVTLAVGGVMGGLFLGAQDDYAARRPTSVDAAIEANAVFAQAEAYAIAADVLFGTGAAIAAAGLVWMILDLTSGGSSERATTLAPVLGPGLAGLVIEQRTP